MRRLFAALLSINVLFFIVGCAKNAENTGAGPHITTRLVADQKEYTPGIPFNVGVLFNPDPEWHVYWKNPGDSGLAPKFTWNIPPSLSLSEALWPYPSRIVVGPLVNYGYGNVLIPFPAVVAKTDAPTDLRVELDTRWLVCRDECLPGSAKLAIELPVSTHGSPVASSDAALFSRSLETIPQPLEHVAVAIEEQDSQIVLSLLPGDTQSLPSSATFFPEDSRVIDNAAPQVVTRSGTALKLILKRANNRTEPIDRIRGVLVSDEGWSSSGSPRAVSIDTRPDKSSDHTSTGAATGSDVALNIPSAGSENVGLGVALLFALLGGLILNLMPCVFPVLSIKILSFVEHAGDERAKIRLHGIAFCVGVLMSFWALAAVLLTLRAGGEQLGWGFQLQSPVFVVVMIFIFFGLGLLFLTDLAIGQRIQTLAGSSKLPTSYLGSFLNGVLATAVATPCTGPFMSSAIAATLTLPAFQSLLIFTSLGIGMSLPYLLLSFEPRLLKFLPRPGMWMETFKQAMAFPLLASVVWLCRVFARQVGLDGIGLSMLVSVLWGLFFFSLGVWFFLRAPHAKRKSASITYNLLALASIFVGMVMAYPSSDKLDKSRENVARDELAGATEIDANGLTWEKYSEERLNNLISQGTPVYLDFTAEWCITCQVNEKIVFGSAQVRELLKAKKVALLKGDWTSMNPAITAALKRYGRNGVPLNVLHKGGAARGVAPTIFPNILTPGIVIQELSSITVK